MTFFIGCLCVRLQMSFHHENVNNTLLLSRSRVKARALKRLTKNIFRDSENYNNSVLVVICTFVHVKNKKKKRTSCTYCVAMPLFSSFSNDFIFFFFFISSTIRFACVPYFAYRFFQFVKFKTTCHFILFRLVICSIFVEFRKCFGTILWYVQYLRYI